MMAKVVLNMKHKYTSGIKYEFVEDTFIDMFYLVYNREYITDEFLENELSYITEIPQDSDLLEIVETLSDDQLQKLIVWAFSDDYEVSVSLKEFYVSSLYVDDVNLYENTSNWHYFEDDEEAINFYLPYNKWDLDKVKGFFEYTISRIDEDNDEFNVIYRIEKIDTEK